MTALIIIIAIIVIAAVAIRATTANEAKGESRKAFMEESNKKLQQYEEEQRQPQTEIPETEQPTDEETDDEYDGLSYEEKIKKNEKDLEKILFETISSLELTRAEKVSLVTDLLSTLEENPQLDETKILKAVVRKLFKTLIDKTPDLMKRAEYEERFEEEKEEMRSRDYVVIDSQWNQFLDDFDELKADLEALLEKPKPQRSFGVSVVETREDEVDGVPCVVANFAVKGLRFRSEEDQEAARHLKVGDPLLMVSEIDNEQDPNAMAVYTVGADGHHIGYVDSKCAGYVKDKYLDMVKFIVSKVDDYADPPYIYAEAFFKKP